MALTDLPSIATGTALANISGSSTTPTAVSLVSTATASSIMLRDTNANVQTNNFIEGYASTATAASTTTLTVGSASQQFFTGTTTQTVLLPVTSTLVTGQQFIVTNLSTGIVTVQSSGGNPVLYQGPNTTAIYTCILTSGTTAASWNGTFVGAAAANPPTIQKFTSGSGTYTTPANCVYLQIKMVGGGGGGAGTGTSNTGGAGGTGGNTTFGANTAAGGSGGGAGNALGGAGGTATVGLGSAIAAFTGATGQGGSASSAGNLNVVGGNGASTPFGGGGAGNYGVGGAGITNTGVGGGGAGSPATSNSAGGGGAGGYIEAVVISPAATYAYAIGAAGTAGTAGTGGNNAGGAGGSGYIEVTEYYGNTAYTAMGGGAVTPTVTTLTSGSGTFTTPSNALYIQVKMVGGGGGGGGGGGSPGGGGLGGNTTFGTSLLTANGGAGAASGDPNSAPPTGGAVTVNSPAVQIIALKGGDGTNGGGASNPAISAYMGASGPWGGAGGGGSIVTAGSAAAANSGSGGGGGPGNASQPWGGNGAAGGFIEAIINSPSATYSYAVGAAGTAGTAGTNGGAGGAGGSGVIIVTTFYNNGTVGTATNVTGVVAKANGGTGSATYPGDYYASVYYPGSVTNYWSNANTSIGDFTATGTIPSPSTFVNSNFGTISKATSSLPGINFSAPRTGTIKITVRGMFQQNTSAAQNTIALIESTTSTTLDNITFNYNTLAADNQPQLLLGYFPATASTTYNFKLQSFSSAGTLTINSGVTSASMLTFSMEYIN